MSLTITAQNYLTSNHNLVNGLGGSAGFGENTMGPNDDNSVYVDLRQAFGADGLSINGQAFTEAQISNNGLVYLYSASGNTWLYLYAYGHDIDTRMGHLTPTPGGNSTGSDLTWYDFDAANKVLTVTWDDVGQYYYQTGNPQAFQLQLIEGSNGEAYGVFRYESVNLSYPSVGYYTAPNYSFTELFTGVPRDQLDTAAGSNGQAGVFVVDLDTMVTPVNSAPVARADTVSTDEDNSVVINVLANDTDADAGDTKTIVSLNASGLVGTATLNADQTVTYNPGSAYQSLAQGQSASTSFQYTMRDAAGLTSTATVSVTVTGRNDAPVAVADSGATSENAAVTVDVLANDTDIDSGATRALTSVSAPAGNGAASIAGGKLVFNPGADFDHLKAGVTEQVTVSYTMSDDQGATASSTAVITVTGVNDAPVAVADLAATTENASVTVDVLANDTDVDDGGTKTLTAASAPGGHGVASVVDGKLMFDPGSDFDHLKAGATEQVTVSYTLTDDQGATATSTAVITVTGTNDAPIAVADVGATTENASVTVDVLANDTDVDDGAIKTLTAASAPAGHGAASVVDGKLVFNPGADFDHLKVGATEQVTVSYTMTDDQGAVSSSTAVITVTGTNDAPVAVADAGATTENAAVTVDVLANDTDVDDGATKTLSAVSAPVGKGAASVVDGKLVFNPGSDFDHLKAGATEQVTVSYTLTDDQGAAATSTAVITVTGTNDAPVVSGVVAGATTEDSTPVTLNARANVSDVDDDAVLTVVNVPATLPAGVTYDAAAQSFRLNPGVAAYQHLGIGQTEVVTVAYGVSDASVTVAASVSWTIIGTNDAPVAAPDSAAVSENGTITLNVLANDSDVDDGDSRTISAVGPTALGGSVSIVDGKIVYVAGDDSFDALVSGQSVIDSFSYTIVDAHGASASATVAVTVNGVADGADIIGGNQSQNLVGTALDERMAGGNASDTLSGGAGADRLQGDNGDDLLLGGSGRDWLSGDRGADTLDGGAGNDTLSGGSGADVFLFGANFGRDVVTDFARGDVLKFAGAGFTSGADVLAHAATTSAGVLITLNASNSILLQGVSLSSLSASDFLIA